MKITAIIPAHNEEAVIKKMTTMLLAIYPRYITHVLVVDDGSTDHTASILRRLSKQDKRIVPIYRTPPHGVGLAIREGLKHVPKSTDYILTMDADFIRNISDLDEFFTKIKHYDGLIGSRYKEKHSLIRYPAFKWFFNRCFHVLVRMLFGITTTDLTNNFKLYKKKVFDALPLSADDYAINAETGLYPLLLKYTIGEIPVIWFARERNMGVSKFKLLSVAPNYLKVIWQAYRFKR